MKLLNQLKSFLKNNKVFFILLVFTPGIVWTSLQPVHLIKEWISFPNYAMEKKTNLFSEERVKYIEDLRWANVKYTDSDFKSRFFYNKGTVLVDEFFNFITFLSPRVYFQSGDGSQFSPPGVEPIAGVFFLFFMLGLIYILEKRKFKILYFLIIFTLLPYLSGRRNMAFMLPILISYVYITYLGVERYISKKNLVYGIYVISGLYLLGRSCWLA